MIRWQSPGKFDWTVLWYTTGSQDLLIRIICTVWSNILMKRHRKVCLNSFVVYNWIPWDFNSDHLYHLKQYINEKDYVYDVLTFFFSLLPQECVYGCFNYCKEVKFVIPCSSPVLAFDSMAFLVYYNFQIADMVSVLLLHWRGSLSKVLSSSVFSLRWDWISMFKASCKQRIVDFR